MRPQRPRSILVRGPLGAAARAGEVGVEHPGELLLAHPHQQRVVGDAGVGDEHLDRAELVLDRGERGVDRGGVGDVAGDAEESGASRRRRCRGG